MDTPKLQNEDILYWTPHLPPGASKWALHQGCKILGDLEKIFGRDFAKHKDIVLFVCFDGDQHRSQKINDYVARGHATLQGLTQKCGSCCCMLLYELNFSQNAVPECSEPSSGDRPALRNQHTGSFTRRPLLLNKEIFCAGAAGEE